MRSTSTFMPLPALLERAAARHPGRVAVRDERGVLTYAELVDAVHRLAHHLLRCGVDKGRRVVSCLPRGVDAVVVQAAIMTAGAVYIPVDPGDPPELIGELLTRTRPTLIIGTSRGLAACRAAQPWKALGGIALDCPRTQAAIAASPATPRRLGPSRADEHYFPGAAA